MSHPVDVHVGKRLRLRRSLLGHSQEVIGKVIGTTFQQIQKYERGINRISASKLYMLAGFLDATISYFFEGLEDTAQLALTDEKAGGEYDKLATRETLEIMRAYYRIKDPKVRSSVFNLIKAQADACPVERKHIITSR